MALGVKVFARADRRHSALAGVLMIATALGSLAIPAAASAQARASQVATRNFNIPAQSLSEALTDFGQQSGLQVSVDSAAIRGLSTQGVTGSLPPAKALSQLLSGTGFTFRLNGNVVTLERAPQASGSAIQLGPVRVEGEGGKSAATGIAASITSDPDATENTGSFTTKRMSSATKMPLTIRETPQAVTVITSARLEQENLVDLIDIVDTVPGLFTDYSNARPLFISRGREVDRLTQNGIVILHDSYVPSSLGNMAMQDRVEIVRGATGLMQGGGNPSGAINFIRKRPTQELQFKGSASAGSWSDYRLTADVSGPITSDGRIRARAVGAFQDAGNFRDIEFDDSRLGYITFDFDLTERTTVNLGYSYLYTHKNMTWGAIPVNPDGTHRDLRRSTYVGTDWEYNDNKVHAVYGSLAHDFGAGWAFNLNATYVDASTDLLQTNFRPYAADGTLNHVWWAARKDREQKAVDAYVSGPLTLFGRSHEVVLGGTINHENTIGSERFGGWGNPITSGVDLATWDHQAPYPDFDAAGVNTFNYSAHNKQDSLYASGRFSLVDSLSLVLGTRLDWYDRTSLWGGAGYKVDGHLTKYAGLTWGFGDHHSAYVSYTDVFQPQSEIDVSRNFLPPVIGKNYEVGIKGEYFAGALNSSIILFRTDETNRAVELPDQSGCPTYPTNWCYSASGLVRTWGVDTELQGELSPGWQVGAGFTWSRTRYAKDEDYGSAGERLDTSIPTTQFKLSTQYRLPGALDRFTLGGRVSWQSKIYYDLTNISGATVRNQQDAYAVVDLSATYRPTEHLSLQVEVNNVFDKTYYRHIGAYNYMFSAQEIFGEPRNVLVTLRANF